MYFLRRIKDVLLLFPPKKEDRKIFELWKKLFELWRKTSFCIKFFTKKIQFIIVDFQTQFIDDKKKTVKRNPVEANHFRESQSFYQKPFLSVEAASFSWIYSF